MICPFAYFKCIDAAAKGIVVKEGNYRCAESGCASWGIVSSEQENPGELDWTKIKMKPVYGCLLCRQGSSSPYQYTYPFSYNCASESYNKED